MKHSTPPFNIRNPYLNICENLRNLRTNNRTSLAFATAVDNRCILVYSNRPGAPFPCPKVAAPTCSPRIRTSRSHVEDDFEHVADDAEFVAEHAHPPTEYLPDESQSIVAENDSPDIGFRYSVNPYRGCAHGCSYCYARPGHEYLGMSAGLDFETKILVKHRAAELLRDWLARPSWQPETIAFSGVTDCYQPAEREFQLTRGCLEVAAECRQPIGIITKNALVTRDIDLLAQLAAHNAVRVCVSITTLDAKLARVMEPRTSPPAARLRAIRELSAAGISAQRDDRPDHSRPQRQRDSGDPHGRPRRRRQRAATYAVTAADDRPRRVPRLAPAQLPRPRRPKSKR